MRQALVKAVVTAVVAVFGMSGLVDETSAATLSDDFNDGVVHPLWSLQGNCVPPTETGGEMVFAKPIGCIGGGVLRSRAWRPVTGDFDVTVDFDLVSFAVPSTGYRFAGLAVYKGPGQIPVAKIERFNNHAPYGDCPPSTQNYKAWTTTSEPCEPSVEWAATIDNQGRFRISRQGALLKMYYWNGSWVELQSEIVTSDDLRLYMQVYTQDGDDGAFDVRFDNFVLNDEFVKLPALKPAGAVALVASLLLIGTLLLVRRRTAS